MAEFVLDLWFQRFRGSAACYRCTAEGKHHWAIWALAAGPELAPNQPSAIVELFCGYHAIAVAQDLAKLADIALQYAEDPEPHAPSCATRSGMRGCTCREYPA